MLNVARAVDLGFRNELAALLRPPRRIAIPDWVEQNVKLTPKSCSEPGPLRISRTPYTRDVLLALGNPFVEWIVLCWGRQLSKTEGVQIPFICYAISEDPGPATILFPTQVKGKEVEAQKIGPMLEACEAVVSQMTRSRYDYTTLRKEFMGMILFLAWAGSAGELTSRSNRYLLRDEIDEYEAEVGADGTNPMKGIEETTTAFSNRKILDTSTPTHSLGNIWQGLKSCRYVFEYWIPCPYCGEDQILYWNKEGTVGGIKWNDEQDPETAGNIAYYECEFCQGHITNAHKIVALLSGQWRARLTPEPCDQILQDIRVKIDDTISLADVLDKKLSSKLGFHLPKWYSPFALASIGNAVKEYLVAARAFKEGETFTLMRDWQKYWAARPWSQRPITETEPELLKNRIGLASLIAPQGTIALTCGIDPGQGGFWFSVVAWRHDYSSHLVHYGFLAGDYDNSEINALVNQWSYAVDEPKERRLPIWRIGIDTGGSQYASVDSTMTAAAYNWIRKIQRPRVVGTKGMSHPSIHRVKEMRIDKMPGDKGIIIPGGLVLLEINTDAMKDVLWFHLGIKPKESIDDDGVITLNETPPGRFTFHTETDEEYVRHLLAEQKRLDKKGHWKWVGVKPSGEETKNPVNHFLDCTVGAFAMADSEFRGGIRVVRPASKPGPPEPPGGGKINPATHRPRGNWAKGW